MIFRVHFAGGYADFTSKNKECLTLHALRGIGEIEELEEAEALSTPWSKEAHIDEINAAHSEWYRKIYTRKPDLDYSSIGEIGLYLNHPDFGAQAQALQQLWWDSVEILYAYTGNVTEGTALSAEAFIATLPQFNL